MSIKIHDNTLLSLRSYFNEKLKGTYPKEELNSLFFIGLDHYLNIKRLDYMTKPASTVSESDILRMRSLANELKKEKPIQYILGVTSFMDLKIKVDENVLIPRPETEEIVDDIIKRNSGGDKILDLCSGSGCIALALKKTYPSSEVMAVEISETAMKVAEENARLNDLDLEFINDDVLHLKTELPKFNLIVSNPPYVRNLEKSQMSKNVLEYEPKLALFVEDDDPLVFYRKIISISVEKLSAGGWLYMEINEKFGSEIKSMMEEAGISNNLKVNQDLNGKDRWVSGQMD